MMDRHYPNSSWVRLHPDTTDSLRKLHRRARACFSIDAAIVRLLESATSPEAGA